LLRKSSAHVDWQMQKTQEAAKSGGILVLGGDDIALKLQETLSDNKKLERKIAELNTVVGQLRGQIKVLEAKLKDAALAQQSNVPDAILQLRGRWSNSGSIAAQTGTDTISNIASGGVGIGVGVGGSSSSEVLQLRAEIEKCVRDMQRSRPFIPLTC
jgi:outer membrane murein-binding lipoprotein Lpp